MTTPKFDIEKFNGENDFSLWKIKMKAILTNQGVAEALSREAMEGMTDRIKAREVMLKAHSTLLLSLSDSVLREIADEPTALEVWEKLDEVYLGKSLANRLILKKQLYTLTMEETKDVRRHLDDFNRIILDLRSVDVRIEDEDQAIILLSSLHKGYENIVDTLLYGKQSLSMNEVKSVLMSKEIQKKSEGVKDGEIFVARGRTDSKGKKSQRSRSKSSAPKKCFYCHKEGHFKRDCFAYKKKWQKEKGGKEVAENSNVAEGSEGYESSEVLIVSTKITKEDWILDSGCSFHMCPHEEWFTDLKKDFGTVLLGDDNNCAIQGCGTVFLSMKDDSTHKLEKVRYVPDLRRNLISIGMLDEEGCSIRIEHECIKIVKGSMVIMKGSIRNGLYVLAGLKAECNLLASKERSLNSTQGWHQRLGHISLKGLEMLKKGGLFLKEKFDDLEFCEDCVLGKAHKVRFSKGIHYSKGVLDYINSDLWGPARVQTKGVAKYFLSMVDEYSRRVRFF